MDWIQTTHVSRQLYFIVHRWIPTEFGDIIQLDLMEQIKVDHVWTWGRSKREQTQKRYWWEAKVDKLTRLTTSFYWRYETRELPLSNANLKLKKSAASRQKLPLLSSTCIILAGGRICFNKIGWYILAICFQVDPWLLKTIVICY